jgi:predicted lipid-binding transport protein (Tim44 family)
MFVSTPAMSLASASFTASLLGGGRAVNVRGDVATVKSALLLAAGASVVTTIVVLTILGVVTWRRRRAFARAVAPGSGASLRSLDDYRRDAARRALAAPMRRRPSRPPTRAEEIAREADEIAEQVRQRIHERRSIDPLTPFTLQ